MSAQNTFKIIIEQTQQIIQDKSEVCPELKADTAFLKDTPMDSLDLATLLVNLEIELDQDPFRDGFKQFQTIQELSDLYQ
jgi:acyl carrier protein